MKYVKLLIFILSLIVYGYSEYKISVGPNEVIWSWICVILFPIIFIWFISYMIHIPQKKSENSIVE